MSSPDPSAVPPSSPAPRTYVPGHLGVKLGFLVFGLLVLAFGGSFLWEPVSRLMFGKTTEARVAEIRVVEPGQPDVIYNYRREYPPERNLAITFQHWVAINVDGRPELFRISVDSRKAPIPELNVNDTVPVAYDPRDPQRLAFPYKQERTWGAGGLFFAIGLSILLTGIPMALAARRPIVIDPEAPPPAPATAS